MQTTLTNSVNVPQVAHQRNNTHGTGKIAIPPNGPYKKMLEMQPFNKQNPRSLDKYALEMS